MDVFGKLLEDGRKRHNMTLGEASKKLGISLTYLCDMEKGRKRKLKMDFLARVSGVYGIPTDDLCIAAQRIPPDVYYAVAGKKEMFEAIRAMKG